MYVSYLGLRVRDLERSVRFYTEVFGLELIQPAGGVHGPFPDPTAALLRDPLSGQRLELNYYPEGTPYGVPYLAGEELDHIGIGVDHLVDTLARLEMWGIRPEAMKHYAGPVLEAGKLKMAYVRDPDGVQLELFEIVGEPARFDPQRY